MGANAQTSVPTFTAGQVLTAAQMNDSARTGVPVFADASARDAAFGGTGEKTLAEGQLAYLEDSDVVQYYDGSNWLKLAPTTEPGLVLVKTQTIGTTVSSVTVTDAFSATYDNYYISVDGGAASTTNSFRMTLGATTTGYYTANFGYTFAGAYDQGAGANAAFWSVGYGASDGLSAAIYIMRPNLADQTYYNASAPRLSTTGIISVFGGYLNNTTQYTDFTLTASTGTYTGGEIRVYGYQNS